MRKRIMSLGLVLVMVMGVFTTAFASQRQDVVDDRMQGLTQEEMAAIDAATTLEELAEMQITLEELLAIDAQVDAVHGENFSANQRVARPQLCLIEDGWMRARDGSFMYPDFYGGSGFDYDGKLIIFIVESQLEQAYNHEVIGDLLKAGERYRLVEYSFVELFAVQDAINEIAFGQRDWCMYSYNLAFVSAWVLTNRVVVSLVEYNEDMVAGFRRYVYDSPMLIFEQGDRICTDSDSGWPFRYYDIDGYFNNGAWDYTHYHWEEIVPFNTNINTGTVIRRRNWTGFGARGTVGFRVACSRHGMFGFLTTAGDTLVPGMISLQINFLIHLLEW